MVALVELTWNAMLSASDKRVPLVVSLGGPTVQIFRSFLLVWLQRVFAPSTDPFLVSFSVLETSSGDYVSSLALGLTLSFPSLFYRVRVPPFAVFGNSVEGRIEISGKILLFRSLAQ